MGGERYFACEAWDAYGTNTRLGKKKTKILEDHIKSVFDREEREGINSYPITINEVNDYVESWTGYDQPSNKAESSKIQRRDEKGMAEHKTAVPSNKLSDQPGN